MKSLSLPIMLLATLCTTQQIIRTTPPLETLPLEKATIVNGLIVNGIVKGAAYYMLFNGYTRTENNVEKKHKPHASFWGYDQKEKDTVFLGEVEIENFDTENLNALNRMLDPNNKMPVISRATIQTCIKRGRYIAYYDYNGNLITTSSNRYDGPIDLKAEENKSNTGVIQPPVLLQNLEKVTESKPRYWILALLGICNTMERKCIEYPVEEAIPFSA